MMMGIEMDMGTGMQITIRIGMKIGMAKEIWIDDETFDRKQVRDI